MRVNGSVSVAAPMPDVWQALRDPVVLARTIPGCERLDEVGPDTYAMTIRAGVASIKGTYAGQVALSDHEPPHSFTLRARGQGAPGTVDATVRVRLSEVDGGTRVDYDADATVGGMIGGVGQRMLVSVGKRTAGEFFSAVELAITRPPVAAPGAVPGAMPGVAAPVAAVPGVAVPGMAAPGVAVPGVAVPGVAVPGMAAPGVAVPGMAAPGVAVAAPTVGVVPTVTVQRSPSEAWAMASAFTTGGLVALAGVAVGWTLARRARHR